MKVLVIGSGGREHALCWRLARCPSVERVYCAPGNPGTAEIAQNVAIGEDQHDALVSFAAEQRIDLTVVGPEAPLCAGIADRFVDRGLLVAGPSAAAAQLEGSKLFAKRFMVRHGIPTAAYYYCEDLPTLEAALEKDPRALVLKADGLAAGKGVVVADTTEDVAAAARLHFSRSGEPLLLEQRLVGEEVSVIALADGERFVMLESSQDHKAALDGDRGPNTGGMGAYSPAPVLTPALAERVQREVLWPTINGMAADGRPFRGVLYAGLMIVGGAPLVLEYNCRFGDPETQVLMARLRSDLGLLLLGVAQGSLPSEALQWDPRPAICVVLAAEGYPGAYRKGAPVILPSASVALPELSGDSMVFQAGTAFVEGQLVTAGGRVLGVTALGESLDQARTEAYVTVKALAWPGAHYRSDIGARGIDRDAP